MRPRTLVRALLASVERSPEAIAVTHAGHSSSYGELLIQTQAVATHFRESGLAPGARVALLLGNSVEYIAACYGIWAAGGVVVPLNTAARSHDILSWLRHSGAAWLIADVRNKEFDGVALDPTRSAEIVAVGTAETVQHTRSFETIVKDKVDGTFDWPTPRDGDPAAIVYTSGTTGRPKGVTLSHGNFAANTASILEYLKLSSNDSCLNVLPFYYSFGSSVLHTHLAVGARIVLSNTTMYPHALLQAIAADKLSGFYGVPSTYALLLARTQLHDYDLSSLRYIAQAGGAMPPAHIARLREALPHAALFVMYGQTEATARLTCLPPDRLAEKIGSVGLPIPGVEIDIRGSGGQSMGPDERGEIFARGGNIMLGYWQDPEATRSVVSDGWLRTGDLAHRDRDGFIFIAGRATDMIKSGAHRINPQEIEETIAQLAEVDEVAVVGMTDDVLGQSIRAVVVLKAETTLTAMKIQAHCHQRLASYKVPKHVAFAESLPKTASGKIKRYLLTDEGVAR